MARQREIRDPVHGFIERLGLEERIIDAPVFQRLRRISQLALAHLVYPGALHTRFDHSLGAMHVARRLADRLIDDEEKRRLIRLAALLHDIGHGPFSHVSEDILDRYYDNTKVKPKQKEKIHELITCEIIEKNSDLSDLLSRYERQDIIEIISGADSETIMRNIISGPLDADKQDYLLRDSYFCGVKYGVFDLERLIITLEPLSDNGDTVLAASHDGIYAIEQFVLAKYHMITQVYRHKIRLVTDGMIVRALELGLDIDQFDWLRKIYVYDGSTSFVEEFLSWNDDRIINQFLYNEIK